MQIRKALLTDSEPLFALVKDFATSFKPDITAFDHSLECLLKDDDALLNVAVFENTVVGYCLAFDHYAFYANGRVTWVEEVMVRNDYLGKGIGRDLMSSVEKWAVSRKSKLIGLATRRAAPFYNAVGYEESATFFRKVLGD